MRYIYLSHSLTNEIPVYGRNASLNFSKVKSIAKGDSVNISEFTMQNHWGTHIDTPNHFFDGANNITDYQAEFWLFKFPQIIKVTLKPAEILKLGDWINEINPNTDFLLFCADWSKLRKDQAYTVNNPGISPDVALHLRSNFPKIRAIGIDWISISSFQDRDIGRKAHKIFLDPSGPNNPILIIEDMDLSDCNFSLQELMVFPLRLNSLDGAPCTVIGGFKR